MDNVNKIIGKNLLNLRKNAKLTQLELAEKFNYSDKTISKWESGESLPSVEVLFEIATFYGVTLNDLVSEQESIKPIEKKEKKPKRYPPKLVITLLAVSVVWLCATVTFVCLLLFANITYPICFLWAVPASCIVLLVFNSIWGRFRYLFIILSVLVWSILTSLHIQLLIYSINIWPIYILGAPLQIAIILWGALVRKPKGYYKKLKDEQNELS